MVGYLYILHSKAFDEFGENTCNKFGTTKHIECRKFDTCYRTAFIRECKYRVYYKLLGDTLHYVCEAMVKRELKHFRELKGVTPIGEELYFISWERLDSIVCNMLTSNKIGFERYTVDIFNRPPEIMLEDEREEISEEELEDILMMRSISEALRDKTLLTPQQIAKLKTLKWVYKHNDKKGLFRCMLCNREHKHTNHIANSKWAIEANLGSTCVNSSDLNLAYHSAKVEEIVESCGMKKRNIWDCDSDINDAVKDKTQVIYSYHGDRKSAYDSVGKPDISNVGIICESLEAYDPSGAALLLYYWLINTDNTWLSAANVDSKLAEWNDRYRKHYTLETLKHFISNHKHVRYEESTNVFYLPKYKEYETYIKNFVTEQLKKNAACSDKEIRSIFFLTGAGGTGKTHWTCCMPTKGFERVHIAPTGKAVSVMQDKYEEIHKRKLEDLGEDAYNNYMLKKIANDIDGLYDDTICHKTIHMLTYGHTWKPSDNVFLWVDEISMVDTKLLFDLFSKLREVKNLKLHITGDLKQLPPVGFGTPARYLSSELCKSDDTYVTLTEVHRSNTYIYTYMDDIMKKSTVLELKDYLDATYPKAKKKAEECLENKDETEDDKKFAEKTIKRGCAHDFVKYNEKEVHRLKKDGYQFISYRNRDKDELNWILNKRTVNKAKAGDKIMFVKNGYDDNRELLYHNGQTGTIQSLNKKRGIIIINDGKATKTIYLTEKHKKKCEEKGWSAIMEFADCITIHKSQGSSIEKLCVVLCGDPSPINKKLWYTALSRHGDKLVIMYDVGWDSVNLIEETAEPNTCYQDLAMHTKSAMSEAKKKAFVLKAKDQMYAKLGYQYVTYSTKWKIYRDMPLTKRDYEYLKEKKIPEADLEKVKAIQELIDKYK